MTSESFYYSALVLFAIAVYFIATDDNAARLVNIRFMEMWVNIRRRWFIITMYPRIKYDTWRMKRYAKKLQKELNGRENKTNSGNLPG